MSILEKIFKIGEKQRVHYARYIEPAWQSATGQGLRSLPELVRLAHYYYDTSILLRTIISVLERETFKNSFAVIKDGVKIKKDESIFKSLINRANDTQTLEEVMRSAYIELNICANAIIIAELEYSLDQDGLMYKKLKQIYKANLEFCELIISQDGRSGMTDQGMVMFCPHHREVAETVKLSGDAERDYNILTSKRCRKCDFPLLPAFLRFYHPTYGYLHYSQDEVIHLKKWNRQHGMGIPPIATYLMYLYIMEAHNYFISTAYSLQRPPNSLILLRAGNVKNLEGAIQRAFSDAQQAPHILPIISVDADIPEKLIEVINLSQDIKEQDYQKIRDEITSRISALYGVTPIFTGDLRGVGGLNQEGLQIMVTNRVIEDEQRILNIALQKISLLIDPTGSEYIVMEKNEIRDDALIQDYNAKVLQNVQMLQSLGYNIEVNINDDGRLSYKIIGKSATLPQQSSKFSTLGLGTGMGMDISEGITGGAEIGGGGEGQPATSQVSAGEGAVT